MLKDYLSDKNISLKEVAEKTDIPYSTLNDLSVGRVDFDSVRVGTAMRLAEELDLSFDELYKICRPSPILYFEKKGCYRYRTEIKNKALYIKRVWPDEGREMKVCDVTANNRPFIKWISGWACMFNEDHPTLDSDTMDLFASRTCLLQREAQPVAAFMLDHDGKVVELEVDKKKGFMAHALLKDGLSDYQLKYDDIKRGTYVLPESEEFWVNPINQNLTWAAHKRLMAYAKALSLGGKDHGKEEGKNPSDE